MRAKVIKSLKKNWYQVGEIYLVRSTENDKGIGVQVWNTDESTPHPDVIKDGDYELI